MGRSEDVCQARRQAPSMGHGDAGAAVLGGRRRACVRCAAGRARTSEQLPLSSVATSAQEPERNRPHGDDPHHLRHTCASLLIARGASVKTVQTQLGHSSPTVTLNTYTHLFGDELDALYESRESPASPGQVPGVANFDAKVAEKGR